MCWRELEENKNEGLTCAVWSRSGARGPMRLRIEDRWGGQAKRAASLIVLDAGSGSGEKERAGKPATEHASK